MRGILSYIPVVLIVVSVAIGLFGRITTDTPGVSREDRGEANPRRPDVRGEDGWQGEQGGDLPPPSGRDPVVQVEIPEERSSGQGTAFSIDPRGVWMTARHVADGCDRMAILTGPRQGLRVENVYVHPNADLAILRTRQGAPPLAFSGDGLNQGQEGYHFGFPSGEPAAVQSNLLGRHVMRVRGRYRTAEPVVAWAEAARVPDSHGGLGGISGGPAMDANGRVIGVTVAGSHRRGRVYTTAPVSVRSALREAGVRARSAGQGRPGTISRRDFPEHGAALRRELSVTRVICLVEGGKNRRRPRVK